MNTLAITTASCVASFGAIEAVIAFVHHRPVRGVLFSTLAAGFYALAWLA